jgi:LPS sulfotransferase NodH
VSERTKSICVVSAQRTGSNMLMSMFPRARFVDAGEVFNEHKFRRKLFANIQGGPKKLSRMRYTDPERFLRRCLLRPGAHGGRIVVWNYQYQNIFRWRPEGWKVPLLRAVQAHPEIGIVHLVRDDKIARYVSEKRAQRSGTYLLRDGAPDDTRVAIDAADCRSNVRLIKRMELEVDRLLSRPRMVRVSYEELLANPGTVAERMAEAFALPIRLDPPRTVRQGRPLRETVENYDDLRRSLKLVETADGTRTPNLAPRPWLDFQTRLLAARIVKRLRARKT